MPEYIVVRCAACGTFQVRRTPRTVCASRNNALKPSNSNGPNHRPPTASQGRSDEEGQEVRLQDVQGKTVGKRGKESAAQAPSSPSPPFPTPLTRSCAGAEDPRHFLQGRGPPPHHTGARRESVGWGGVSCAGGAVMNSALRNCPGSKYVPCQASS